MSDPYSELVAEIIPIINEYGRSVSVVLYDQTVADSTKPWRSPSSPMGSAATRQTMTAVVVDDGVWSRKVTDKQHVDKTKAVFFAYSTVDLTGYHEVEDGAARRKIEWVKELKPGTVVLLYAIGVST